MSRIPRAILVGDHRQLPAVVQQNEIEAGVFDPQLQEIGVRHLGTSLFERLYLRALEQNWHWAYDQLSHQGRMHADIMTFPAEHFYSGSLSILPASTGLHLRQLAPLVCLASSSAIEQNYLFSAWYFFLLP